MNNSFLVIEDFYSNVDQVRQAALDLDFNVVGNYPGYRTQPEPEVQSQYLKTFFEGIIGKKITYWPTEYNTAYQYTTSEDKTWIHHDETEYAAVVYLTPDAPVESGTGIYRHKESKIHDASQGEVECTDMDNWEQIAFAGNVYNRLVIYKGSSYHRSVMAGFGNDKETGRLFQTFFFNTEDK